MKRKKCVSSKSKQILKKRQKQSRLVFTKGTYDHFNDGFNGIPLRIPLVVCSGEVASVGVVCGDDGQPGVLQGHGIVDIIEWMLVSDIYTDALMKCGLNCNVCGWLINQIAKSCEILWLVACCIPVSANAVVSLPRCAHYFILTDRSNFHILYIKKSWLYSWTGLYVLLFLLFPFKQCHPASSSSGSSPEATELMSWLKWHSNPHNQLIMHDRHKRCLLMTCALAFIPFQSTQCYFIL